MAAGITVVIGNAAVENVLRQAGIDGAKTLLIAIPEGVEAGAIYRRARGLGPELTIVARVHSDEEVADLTFYGADHIVLAEQATAERMAERALAPQISS